MSAKEIFAPFVKRLKLGGMPQYGTGPLPTDDLTPPTRDSVFLYQLELDDPEGLTEQSLLTAKITETKQYSHDVYKSLLQIGIINPQTHKPDTTKIDRNMVNKISRISVPKQRELVNMLFWWEEELQRWKILREEANTIQTMLSEPSLGEQEKQNLETRLKQIEFERTVKPSERKPDGTLKNDEAMPPAYTS